MDIRQLLSSKGDQVVYSVWAGQSNNLHDDGRRSLYSMLAMPAGFRPYVTYDKLCQRGLT
jgi:hypothetical protein